MAALNFAAHLLIEGSEFGDPIPQTIGRHRYAYAGQVYPVGTGPCPHFRDPFDLDRIPAAAREIPRPSAFFG